MKCNINCVVLIAMSMTITVFRDTTQCSLLNFIDVSEDRAVSTFTVEQYSRQARITL
jgi:hypothetical protein